MIVLLVILYFICYTFGQKYEGCFQSTTLNPDLPLLVSDHSSTPTECIRECYSRHYMYAGLMNGWHCYCGSYFGSHRQSDSCTFPCATDLNSYCESHEAMSIYSTGQKGPSPPRDLQIIRQKQNNFYITWLPPDIPNGNITLYDLRAEAIKTYTSKVLLPIKSQIQGGTSNSTVLIDLQPGTKYNITITAINTQGKSESAYKTEWTSIGPPNKPIPPKIVEKGKNTVTVLLSEGSSENGPISAYQIIVVQPGTIPPVGSDVSYVNYKKSMEQGFGYYITGEFDSSDFHKYKRFVVGNEKLIGGYYNAPLEKDFASAQIGLAVISRVQDEAQYSYSDLTYSMQESQGKTGTNQLDSTIIALCVAITLLGALLIASVLLYFMLRCRHQKIHMTKLPEQQELTLQGPLYEVDNMGYIPEDVPERINHYQELKNKVWSIPRDALTIDNTVIRRGRFGTIHSGVVEKDNKSCNVIVHSIADGLLRPSDKRNMLRELDVCIRASTMKYLAGLVGTSETPDTLYVILEMPPQNLKTRLLAARSGDVFPIGQILPIGASITAALQHLENHKIIHSCLCARSIGLCNDWIPKVMGHGIAKYSLEDIKYTRWTAIESFGNKKKDQRSVIWAFGVLLWEMFSMGGTPYSSLVLDSDVEQAVEQGVRLPQLPDIPDPLYEVMLSCWQNDPQERPTYAELMRLNTLSICPITAITEPYIPELEVLPLT